MSRQLFLRKMNTKGFTLVELLLAMTLFSTVMVITTAGFIGMNRSFTRGVVRKELSEAAQNLNDDVSRAVRSQGVTDTVTQCDRSAPCAAEWAAVCLGHVRFYWQPGQTDLFRDGGDCAEAIPDDRVSVLGNRYRVRAFEISEPQSGLFRVQGVLTTNVGDNLLTVPAGGDVFTTRCVGSAQNAAVATCAVEQFDFIVSARQRGVSS